jgi:hypothetical protein
MKTLFGISFLICLSLIPTLSNAEEIVVVPPAKPRVEVRENSSEHHRMNKNFELTFSPFGFGVWALASNGLNAGYFLNRNSQILMSYNWSVSGKSCWGDWSCELKDRYFSAAYKKFVTNTFYLQGGGSFHRLYTSENIDSSKFSFDADITTLDFAIGSQWNFGGFTFGFDWIGLAYPVIANFGNSNYSDSYSQDEMESKQGSWKSDTRGIAVRFYLGATF